MSHFALSHFIATHMVQKLTAFLVSLLVFVVSCAPPNKAVVPLPSHVDAATSNAIVSMMQTTVVVLNSPTTPEEAAAGVPERYAICTGTWISPTEILTAYHCAIGGSMLPGEGEMHDMLASKGLADISGRHVRFAIRSDVDSSQELGDDIRTARDSVIDRYDVASDIAILRSTKTTTQHWAIVVNRSLEFGERVRVVSHSAMLTYAYSEGYVSHPKRAYSLSYADGTTSIVQIASDMLGGSSGAAVFDSDGRLIGVMVAVLGRTGDLSLVIHHDNVRRLIREKSDMPIGIAQPI